MGNKLKTVDAETLLSTPDEQDDVHRRRPYFAGRQCHQRCQQDRQKLADAVAGVFGVPKKSQDFLGRGGTAERVSFAACGETEGYGGLVTTEAQGNSIWGLPTLQCDVLYLSLEDTQRRIKDRLYNLTDSAPDNLYFAVTSGLIGGGLEEQITDFLTEHPATKLVIIDTLQKVRDSKGSTGKAGMYGNDYDDISSIKRIADGFNIAFAGASPAKAARQRRSF